MQSRTLNNNRMTGLGNKFIESVSTAVHCDIITECDHQTSQRSFAVSFWMSSREDIALSLYFRTILEKKTHRRMLITLEMLLDELFEPGTGSTSASFSCLHSYQSNIYGVRIFKKG